ncbi:melanocortin-2 receptor accessory protein [Pipistrellus kuhlii]|uniref:melanocortin-2 receptor accessory protein n=1 Tax=Pipistrellus kuhlii TaxID=59472 RepID=UPI00174F489D|nr:melanocortin-2 receptor accessory protein [Pipistrellus kuhlii]
MAMANSSNASAPAYEYYLDYLDLLPVDERQLGAHKYSVVIAFWASLAAFVVLLFLVLLSMSRPAPAARSHAPPRPACPWSLHVSLPFCIRRHPLLHSAPQRAPPSSAREPGSSASGPSASPPTTPQAHPALLWEQALDGDPHGIS